MAAPSYTTDLVTVTTAETTTAWSEMSGRTFGGAPTQESDYYIQGNYCVSQSVGGKTGTQVGLEYDYGSDITAFTDGVDCFFFWQIVTAGNAMDTFANGGLRLCVGSSSGNVNCWISGGNNFGRNPYGGWQNIAIDPTYTPDYTDGTPTASTYQIFASYPNFLSAISKGNPHGVDAIRWGRGELIIEFGDVSNGYGTFSGIAAQNDANDATNGYNRWGLLQAEGTGYLWKGLMSFGNATNACDFRDSNVNITVDNTPRTYAAFNKIEITNASSRVDWDSVNIIALNASQLSPGNFEVVTSTADVNIDNCSFTDMNTFIFGSASTVNNTTFRRCAQVTQNSGVFNGCSFINSDAAVSLLVSNLNNVDNCDFTSDGSNHAMELTNAHAGNSYTLSGCTYTGYAASDGSTGNECIYNNSGGAVTINIDGGDTPTIRNGAGATTTIVSNTVTTTITVRDLSTGSVIEGANVLVWVTGSPPANYFYQDSVSITGSGTTATVTHNGHGLSTNDYVIIEGVTNDDDYNGVFQVTVTGANTYTYTTTETLGSSPATGTPTSTFALISGTTDVNGEISDTRSLPGGNQTIAGRVRKSSSSPFYVQGALSGTISNTTGFSTTVQLARDE